MGSENLDALFFGLSVGLAGFVVLLVAVKILRRSGVIPYPPFKSRAEYLEAALEMNLDLFIGRAKATPRSVIEKPVPPKPEEKTPGIISQVKAFKDDLQLSLPNNIFMRLSNQIDVAAVAHVLAPGISGDVPKPLWLRVKKTGELATPCGYEAGCSGVCGLYVTSPTPVLWYHPDELEPAYPKTGEWWQKKPCPKVHDLGLNQPTSWISGLVKWSYSTNTAFKGHGPEIGAALCGCLVPVRFGKGDAAKAPPSAQIGLAGVIGGSAAAEAASVEKKPLWSRVTKTGELVGECGCKSKACDLYLSSAGGLDRHRPGDVEPAVPKPGEWWINKQCVQHSKGEDKLAVPQRADGWCTYGPVPTWISCGCLEPVNFGKGMEQKSGVA